MPDDHCRPISALATIQPAFTDTERVALAGFLAGYRGLTREAYALDLRQFASWCRSRSLALFAVRRARHRGLRPGPGSKGRARATVTRRLSTIAGFYKYAVEEDLLERSPPPTCADRGSTTNHMPSRWTATSSAPCLSRPGSGRSPGMR